MQKFHKRTKTSAPAHNRLPTPESTLAATDQPTVGKVGSIAGDQEDKERQGTIRGTLFVCSVDLLLSKPFSPLLSRGKRGSRMSTLVRSTRFESFIGRHRRTSERRGREPLSDSGVPMSSGDRTARLSPSLFPSSGSFQKLRRERTIDRCPPSVLLAFQVFPT